MLKSGRIAVSKFNGDAANTSYTHVVYQDTENSIRESRYDNINGWTTSPDPVIAPGDNVLKDSPIAIVTWNFGREVYPGAIDVIANTCMILENSLLS